MADKARDTSYAKELATGIVKFKNGGEGRVERLKIKQLNAVEIRFSWWQDKRMQPRPLDLSEESLLELFEDGVTNNVFTTSFREKLRDILS
jgi:hypothetical protein